MKRHHLALVAASAVALSLVSGCAVADPGYGYGYDSGYFLSRHPNIQAADVNAQQAIEGMRAAQQANHYDMGGHAGRAIHLMQDARAEMAMAAEAATR